jgi:hypothetical protein
MIGFKGKGHAVWTPIWNTSPTLRVRSIEPYKRPTYMFLYQCGFIVYVKCGILEQGCMDITDKCIAFL